MIRLPIPIVISQWALLLGLGLLLLVLYRQLAYLLAIDSTRSGASALAEGEDAPGFLYTPLSEPRTKLRFDARGAPTLLVFVDPYCVTCSDVLADLAAVARDSRGGVRLLPATDAPREHALAVEAFRKSPIPIAHIDTRVPRDLYRAQLRPFFFAISGDGRVVQRGAFRDREDVATVCQDLSGPNPAPDALVVHGIAPNGNPAPAPPPVSVQSTEEG